MRRSILGLDAFLPAAENEEALLRSEAQHAIVPGAIVEHSEFFEKLASQRLAFGGNRNVVRGPGEAADLVLTPARIAAGTRFHFEQHEIAETALVQVPGGAQARHAAADDDDRNFDLALGGGERDAIAQTMAERERVVDEAA